MFTRQNKTKYKHSIHDEFDASPSIIVPILLRIFNIKSVVDVGCGIGNWLLEFQKHQVSDLLGIDGPHLNKSLYLLDLEQLSIKDLEKPIRLNRKFDLAISLEVAEHLSKESAENFIKSLCSLSDNIVFSAAVPNQGGQNHLNENWPSYWKSIFQRNGYHFYDVIRPAIWSNQSVRFWYRQNMFIATKHPLKFENITETLPVIDFIHPSMLELKLQEALNGEFGIRIGLKTLINSIKLSLKQKFASKDL